MAGVAEAGADDPAMAVAAGADVSLAARGAAPSTDWTADGAPIVTDFRPCVPLSASDSSSSSGVTWVGVAICVVLLSTRLVRIAQPYRRQAYAIVVATALRAGAFAFADGSLDAALLVTLAPGAYTAVVTGVGEASGLALVEVYDVN